MGSCLILPQGAQIFFTKRTMLPIPKVGIEGHKADCKALCPPTWNGTFYLCSFVPLVVKLNNKGVKLFKITTGLITKDGTLAGAILYFQRFSPCRCSYNYLTVAVMI